MGSLFIKNELLQKLKRVNGIVQLRCSLLVIFNLPRKRLHCSFELKILIYFHTLRKGGISVNQCHLLCNIFKNFSWKIAFQILILLCISFYTRERKVTGLLFSSDMNRINGSSRQQIRVYLFFFLKERWSNFLNTFQHFQIIKHVM